MRSQVAEARVFERALALALLVPAVPVMAVLGLMIWLSDPGPVLYRGLRLGREKRLFTMFKLRTLRVGAQQVVGSALMSHRYDLTIRGGRFLRDTRLDELPQLVNVLRGEMRFVGPRPERPEVYEGCRSIPGYERRFAVAPGLIGLAQLRTPHGTSKRYRTLFDNAFLRGSGASLSVVPFTIVAVLRKASRRVLAKLWRGLILEGLLHRRRERRRLRREEPAGAVARVAGALEGAQRARVLDMNEQAVAVAFEGEFGDAFGGELELEIPVERAGEVPAWRSVPCQAYETHRRATTEGTRVVLQYRPLTARGEYMVHQYFLRSSLAPPRRTWAARSAPPAPPGPPRDVPRRAAGARRSAPLVAPP